MRIISCEQCGDIVAEHIEVCNNCGSQLENKNKLSISKHALLLVPIFALIVGLIILID